MAFRAKAKDKLDAIKPIGHLIASLFLFFTSFLIWYPAITDITVEALCSEGSHDCNVVVFVTALQIVVIGVGSMVVAPIIGSLSDRQGRKPWLLFIFVANLIPTGLLAFGRGSALLLCFLVINTLVAVLRDGSLISIALAYVADEVEERQRAPAFGIAMAPITGGYVLGTLISPALSAETCYQVAFVLSVVATVYLKFFLSESRTWRTLLPSTECENDVKSTHAIPRPESSWSSLWETVHVVRQNTMLWTISWVAFLGNLGEAGLQTSILYYMKAILGFEKNEYATFYLVCGSMAIFSQIVVFPVLAHIFGERNVLIMVLFMATFQAILYSISWAPWVANLGGALTIASSLIIPCVGTLASRITLPEEQGKVQGFVAGVRAMSLVLAPILISPLTALFMSRNAPFNYPGFGIGMCSCFYASGMILALRIPSNLPPPL